MSYDRDGILQVKSEGPIRIITMNDPDNLNSMVDPLHHALTDIWIDIMRDEEVRAVVLTGAGRAFCAGGNIPGFVRNVEEPAYRWAGMRNARILMDHMLSCHVPVIAAINGPAVGLGASIAVACDIVLIADHTFIADTHVNVGLVAGDGGVVSWPLMMSILKAKEYLFSGDRIPAATAVELGLANRAVPLDSLMDEAMELARRYAAQPPQALQETKRSLNLHLQAAALRVLPYATATESESFSLDVVRERAMEFKNKAKS